MWRGWLLCNDAIIGSSRETITESVMFIESYSTTLPGLSMKENKGTDVKGNVSMDSYLGEFGEGTYQA
jgi:hypothetical protein